MIPADIQIVNDFNKFAEKRNLRARLRIVSDMNGVVCLVAEADGGLLSGECQCVLSRSVDTESLIMLTKALKELSCGINIR